MQAAGFFFKFLPKLYVSPVYVLNWGEGRWNRLVECLNELE
jgi:hypothetical protein